MAAAAAAALAMLDRRLHRGPVPPACCMLGVGCQYHLSNSLLSACLDPERENEKRGGYTTASTTTTTSCACYMLRIVVLRR